MVAGATQEVLPIDRIDPPMGDKVWLVDATISARCWQEEENE
jgi:hypothetical protein